MNFKISKFWTIYLVYYVATCIIIINEFYSGVPNLTTFDIIESIIILIGTVGLCGYIFKIPILNSLAWKIFCLPFIGIAIYILYKALFSEPFESIGIAIATVVIFILLFFPLTYALINYSFFQKELWQQDV